MDDTWDQLRERLDGLSDAEYRWEPAPGAWNVRPDGGGWRVDFVKPDPDPAPVTTIAWRMWHIAVDCLDFYSGRAFGAGGTGLTGTAWVGTAGEAAEKLGQAWDVFSRGVAAAELQQQLGPEWGSYADSTYLDLALHAHREVTHHGAEVALLRDLYRATGAG